MKKIILITITLGFLSSGAIGQTCYKCQILDTYLRECPKPRDLSPDPNFEIKNCICTSGANPICRVMDLYDSCPTSVKNCNCKEVECSSSGGGSTGGGTALECTACYDTDWIANGTGYQVKKTGGTCVGNTSTSHGVCTGQTIEYRCAPGYCGTTTDGKTGCTNISGLQTYCRVLDKFLGECPSGAQDCICNNTNPPVCMDRAFHDTLPSWATQYECLNIKDIGNGYQSRQTIKQTDSACSVGTISYNCASGYYGTATSASSGCTPCPAPGTSAVQSPDITLCYVPKNQTISDETGNYEFTINCYYETN